MLGQDLTPASSIGLLESRDKITKGMLWAGLRKALNNPPEELLASLATLGEAYDWYCVRQEDAPAQGAFDALALALDGMRTAQVRLRPIAEPDLPSLYASALDPQWSHRWRYRGSTPSFADFASGLFAGVLSQYLIERTLDGRVVGLTSCYNARVDQGWAYLGFTRVASSPSRQSSEMLEGGFLFISFLFRTWPFRKLYAEISGWNWEQFETGAGGFFTLEGVLKDHEFFDGRFWDYRVVSITREAWDAVSPSLASLYLPSMPRNETPD